MIFEEEFTDVRDSLPNNKEEVLFVTSTETGFVIHHGIFEKNDRLDYWEFISLSDYQAYVKGKVFKWTLAPKFQIVTDKYPEGKPIPLKYCKFQYTSIEDRFFQIKPGIHPIDAPNDPEEFKKAKQRMVSFVPFCDCGKKSCHTKRTTEYKKIDYPVTIEKHFCEDCLPKQQSGAASPSAS